MQTTKPGRDIYESPAQTREYITHIHGYLVGLVTESDPVIESMASLVHDAYGNFMTAHRDARAHLEELGECDMDGTNFHLPPSMWARIRWWYYEKDTATKLGKLDSHKQNFTTILLTLIARKFEERSGEIKDLRRAVDETGPRNL